MPLASSSVCVLVAAALPPKPISRCAAVAPRSAVPPRRPAAPGPGSKERRTPAVTRSGAARPAAPATGGGGRNGATRGSARPADCAGPKKTAPSASRAARHDARSIDSAIAPGAPPMPACAANSPLSVACRAAAGASHWRRSASLQSGRAPSTKDDISGGAREANVWIARRLSAVPPAVRAAHTVPTPARPSATSCRCGRRRSP